MKKLVRLIKESEDLKIRIYYMILIVGCVSILISLLADMIQELDSKVISITAVCFIFLSALLVLSVKYHIENIGKYVLVYFFNIVFFPITFFVSGGVSSGMVLCYVLALFVLALLLEGRVRQLSYVLCICVLEISIFYTYVNPESVHMLDYRDSVMDIGVTLLIISATIAYIIAIMINAYDAERNNSKELNERLRELSVKDELSGLYNRRELFRRLDSIYQSRMGDSVPSSREDCYIAMFDIDNFKTINDTYGHQFGDLVLASVAQILKSDSVEDKGELAARYGGEEFVAVIRAFDKKTVLERAEKIRQDIERKKWEHDPELTVTISGGIACCEQYDDLKSAIHKADELLYEAKRGGKNQIRV